MADWENNQKKRLIFKDYEYFMTIIEEGGVSKAAEKLFISQSSVSKYLKRLEDNLGLQLFNRESHPLCLTEAGELYFKYIKNIFEQEKELLTNISELKEGIRGIIKVGITFWHSSIFFPLILPVFSRHYPNIHVEAYEGSSQEVIAMLDHDKVNFTVFQFPSTYTNVVFEHLVYERILFVVNKNNPLLKLVKMDPKQEVNTMSNTGFLCFKDESFIMLKIGQNSRTLSQIYCNKLNFIPNVVLETLNVSTAINMVKAGMGVAFIPEMALKLKEQTTGLLFFQVDEPPLRRELGIAYKAVNKLSGQDKLFINTLKELIHD